MPKADSKVVSVRLDAAVHYTKQLFFTPNSELHCIVSNYFSKEVEELNLIMGLSWILSFKYKVNKVLLQIFMVREKCASY